MFSDDLVNIEFDVENIKCPCTKRVYFNPVVLGPCSHIIEGDIVNELPQCPLCDTDIVLKSKQPPAMLIALIENMLAKNPKLYDECYISIDNIATMIKNDAFDSREGRRTIQILEHSQVLLHDKSSGCLVDYKSPAELLLESEVGRKILEKNEKMNKLIQISLKGSGGMPGFFGKKPESGADGIDHSLAPNRKA